MRSAIAIAILLPILLGFVGNELAAQSREHDAVRPMPADTFSPGSLRKDAGDESSFRLSRQGEKLSYMLMPYPMLMGGYEASVGEPGQGRSYYNLGGGAGLRLGYDSLFALSVDALAFSEQGPGYWGEALGASGISPGFGPRDGHLVTRFSGHLQVRPSKHFTIRAGRGKHFFGKGHRSLLLSHHSDVYPYLRIDSEFGHFRYVNLYTKMEHLPVHSFSPAAENKYGAFHYLSFEASERWSLGIFESVIWQGRDTMNPRGYDLNYLNPVIFYRPLEYARGSADRVLIGMDLSYEAFEGFSFYAQGMLDEFLLEEIREGRGWWGNKYGFQLGVDWDGLFKVEPLHSRLEFNTVRPYSYSHGSPVQSYAHRGRPLAHPLGANFEEVVAVLGWEKEGWRVQAKYLHAQFGADPRSDPQLSYGRDLFKRYQLREKEYGNRTGQGQKRMLSYAELEAARVLDDVSGLTGGVTLAMRNVKIPAQNSGLNFQDYQGYFQVFLRSELFPRVRDF